MRATMTLGCLLMTLAACSGGEKNAAQKADASEAGVAKAASATMQIKPGLWETKITFKSIEAKGLPEAARSQMLKAMGSGVTVKSCLTKEQASNPGAEFFGSAKGSNCSVRSREVSGNAVSIAMTCKPDGKTVIESKMTGTFSENSYTMDVNQKTTGTPMGDLVTAGDVEGKWLGECAA